MAHHALSDFSFRPIMFPTESWPAYLGRFADRNELDGLPHLAKCLGLTSFRLLCSTPFKTGGAMGFQLIASSKERRRARETASGRFWKARVCPLCFRERVKFGRALWDRPIQLRCKAHECLLFDRCSACKTDIRHDRAQFDRCQCGQVFAALPVIAAPGWVTAMEVKFAETKTRAALSLAAGALAYFERYRDGTIRDELAMLRNPAFDRMEQCFHDLRFSNPNPWSAGSVEKSPFSRKFVEY